MFPDRLPKRRCLGETNVPRDHGAEDLRPKVLARLPHDLLGKVQAVVIHGQQYAIDLEVRIEVLPEPTNFFESLFGNLDSEKETRISQGLSSVAPELVTIARRAARLRAIFERRVAFMMPFKLDIR